MPLFEVRFATREEGCSSIGWEPAPKDGFECSRREALRRWNHLLDAGLRGDAVEGVVPYLIEIIDEIGEVMLGISTEKDDALVGKWARELVDEYRAKLRRYEEPAEEAA